MIPIAEYSTYGRHILADFWGVDDSVLDDMELLKRYMLEAAEKSHTTVLSVCCEKFEPSGCTILVLLSESHLSIHTYPEQHFAAIDCYTCGIDKYPGLALDYLYQQLKPTKRFSKTFHRRLSESGILDG